VGADVFLVIALSNSATLSNVTYGGTPMVAVTPAVGWNNSTLYGGIYVYRLAGGGTGSQVVVSFTSSTSVFFEAQVISYTGVGSIGTPVLASGYSKNLSSGAVTCASGSVLLNVLGTGYGYSQNPLGSIAGGTSPGRYIRNNSQTNVALAISESTSSATFTGVAGGSAASAFWGSWTIQLNPSAGYSGGAAPGGAIISAQTGTPAVTVVDATGSNPVVYRASASNPATITNSATWTQQAVAGDLILVGVEGSGTVSTVTFNGSPMSLVGFAPNGLSGSYGTLSVYQARATGSGTVSVTMSPLAYLTAVSAAYSGVKSIAAESVNTVSGVVSGSLELGPQTATGNVPGGMIVQFMGTGGWNLNSTTPTARQNVGLGAYYALALMDSTETGTVSFRATTPVTNVNWAGINLVLEPVQPAPTPATVTATGSTPTLTQEPSLGAQMVITTAAPRVTGIATQITPASATMVVTRGTPAIRDNPMQGTLDKLAAGQDVLIQVIGDSTGWGWNDGLFWAAKQGWVGRFVLALANKTDSNVNMLLLGGGYGSFGQTQYPRVSANPGRPTITVRNASAVGRALSQHTFGINAILPAGSVPDVIFLADGFNETLTSTAFAAAYGTFVDLVKTKAPGAPIIVTTQNYYTGGKLDKNVEPLANIFNAIPTQFLGAGKTLPLTPALQSSPTYSGVYVLDTQQSFSSASRLEAATVAVHPNSDGYEAQANWMAGQLLGEVLASPITDPVPTTTILTPAQTLVTARTSAPTLLVTGPKIITPSGAVIAVNGGTPVRVRVPTTALTLKNNWANGETLTAQDFNNVSVAVNTVLQSDVWQVAGSGGTGAGSQTGVNGINGVDGRDGVDGVDGAAASVTVGTVTTLSPGLNAVVSNSGTSSAAVLDFAIPAGETGPPGAAGRAATIAVGTVSAGGTTPMVTNVGTSSAAVLNFTIPGGTGTDAVASVNTRTGNITLTKSDVGLGNVDNTSDATAFAATAALTNKDLTSATNTFPTFNQSTTGSAAKWTTARLLAGNSVDGSAAVAFANKFIAQGTTDTGLSAAQFLGALGTGIVKNTTTTGVLSIAIAADFPTLNQDTTGTASNVTGIVAVANGGTGQTTAAAAITALTGTQTAGRYLRSDGTSATLAAIVAADVPTLNQSTTGTAANVTGTVAVANGGTGLATLTANNVLLGNGTGNVLSVAPGTSGNVLTSNGTTWVSSAATGGSGGVASETFNPFLLMGA
jgi:hypothetical protein